MEGIVEVCSLVRETPQLPTYRIPQRKKILHKNTKRGRLEKASKTGLQGQPPKRRELRVNLDK